MTEASERVIRFTQRVTKIVPAVRTASLAEAEGHCKRDLFGSFVFFFFGGGGGRREGEGEGNVFRDFARGLGMCVDQACHPQTRQTQQQPSLRGNKQTVGPTVLNRDYRTHIIMPIKDC